MKLRFTGSFTIQIRSMLILTSIAFVTPLSWAIPPESTTNLRTLSDLVREFNEAAAKTVIGHDQPPLTEKEVLSAIHDHLQLDEELSAEDEKTLQHIEKTRQIPNDVILRRITRYDDGVRFQHLWWPRLALISGDGPIRSVTIRRKMIVDRPYTQMERSFKKRWGDGLPLLNRLSAYFATDPQSGRTSKLEGEAASQLVAKTRKLISDTDHKGLMDLYHWRGASESHRKFVAEEMKQLLNWDVASIKVTPKQYGGELTHWQAFRTYDTNLPVVGYLVINSEGNEPLSLSLELGFSNGAFRLVNYVEKSFNPPKGRLNGPSWSSRWERLDDDAYEVSDFMTSIGPVISARVSNEEIRRMTRK